MNTVNLLFLVFTVVAGLSIWALCGPRVFSAESRDRRRRRRNYRKVVSRKRGPAVRLAVNLARS